MCGPGLPEGVVKNLVRALTCVHGEFRPHTINGHGLRGSHNLIRQRCIPDRFPRDAVHPVAPDFRVHQIQIAFLNVFAQRHTNPECHLGGVHGVHQLRIHLFEQRPLIFAFPAAHRAIVVAQHHCGLSQRQR